MTAEVKLFEVRDEGTFIPVIAVRPSYDASAAEQYLWARSGYGARLDDQHTYVLLAPVMSNRGALTSDVMAHGSRTLQVAHQHIKDRWDDLRSGDVVDVEYIVGQRPAPRLSERIEVQVPFPHPP